MFLIFLFAAVAVAVAAAGASSSSSSKPVDTATWGALEGGEWGGPPGAGHDVKRDAFYGPPHFFSPTGSPIVRRYDSLERHAQWDTFIRYEVDAAGKRWSSEHYFNHDQLGYDGVHYDPAHLDVPFSHDVLLEVNEGDWSGYPDWKAALGTYLSVAQFVISVVPGIGTGIVAAIATGWALAQGQSLTDAIVAGARAAVPGAPATTAAFDTAYGLAKGDSISDAALKAARKLAVETFGDAGGRAFDIASAIAHGQSIQEAAVRAALSYIPDQNVREFAERVAAGQPVVEAARALGGEAAAKAAKSTIDSFAPIPVSTLSDATKDARTVLAR